MRAILPPAISSRTTWHRPLWTAHHLKTSDNLISSLTEKIAKLTSMLENSSLSESETQALAQYRQRKSCCSSYRLWPICRCFDRNCR